MSEYKSINTGEDTDLLCKREVVNPPLYRVLLLNDDFTTMDFVVQVLEKVFHKPPVEATRIMLSVHKMGSGLCGTYTRDIAETKAETVHRLARSAGYPLRCVTEKE